ncbi:hypothetical protein PWEIH_12970 [Listeria weihenstephanensis FSL R9-0317]|nr:hypothetical protein PWEIH_12970 [Listeria weihenstephanensis FSL R9-0317]
MNFPFPKKKSQFSYVVRLFFVFFDTIYKKEMEGYDKLKIKEITAYEKLVIAHEILPFPISKTVGKTVA